jgi:8-oxo-dGTP pyrophosphatase MutT (NUDIX family)
MPAEDRPSFVVPVSPPAEVATPRDSATVILARDGTEGLEVFMLERDVRSDFAGGAYVFPGGTIDDRDLEPSLVAITDGPSQHDAAAVIEAPPDRALAFYLCAIRETFEEAGALLARRDGVLVHPGAAMAEARRALAERRLTLAEFANAEGLRFAADLLHYFSRWITPELSPRRYDARFFVAAAPGDGAALLHDEVETTASLWVRPGDAIRRWREGALNIIFPTRKTLEALSKFSSTAELLSSTRDRRVEAVLPKIVLVEGEPRVVLPNDPAYHEP